MGGGKKLFLENQLYSNLEESLSKVFFTIHFPSTGNLSLFDRDKLYSEIVREIKKYFSVNGIRYEDIGPVDEGGGGIESFKEILAYIWESGIISFILALWNHIKAYYYMYLNKTTIDLKPRVCIIFQIRNDSKLKSLQSNYIQSILSLKLANLISLSESVANLVCTNRSYILCDISTDATIKSKKFSITFEIKHEQRTSRNYLRLLNLVKNFKVKENQSSFYSLTRWHSIKRTDFYLDKPARKFFSKDTATYYLFISTKILRDYY